MSGRWILVLGALFALLLAVGVACGEGAQNDSMMLGGSEGSNSGSSTRSSRESADEPISAQIQSSESDSFDADEDMSESPGTDGSDSTQLEFGYPPVSAQNRLIVRIVDLTIEVDDVVSRMEDVSGIAVQRGGWVVSESRSSQHVGSISVRVPSAQLDAAIRAISALGLEVLSISSSSQDVTEEYFDVQARISNLHVTADSLRQLLIREGDLEDILEVQRELTRVSEEIEILEGRKRYLEQTSATSLINVRLELAPGSMNADAGPDLQVVEGRPVAFRATFTEPQGIDSYEYWWEFGDGGVSDRRFRTAVTETTGERTTEVVWYAYRSTDQSPYFVTFMIRGTGDGGVVDGEDSIKVNVERVPTIIVSTEDTVTVRASDEVTLTGAFTRPQNVSNLSYEWDFGDGLIPVSGDIDEGEQEITATHEYTIDRSQPYEARFTVEGETDFGAPLISSSIVLVYVEPSAEWIIGFLDIPETARTATQALGYIVQGIIAVGIWVVLLSPIWGAIVALIWFLRRKTSSGMPPRPRPRPEPDSGTAEAEDAPEPDAESGDAEAESGEPRAS